MDEQTARIRELMKEVSGISDAQRAMLQGLTPEGRENLMQRNARMVEETDRMMAGAGASAQEQRSLPYARSNLLASYLRSAMQRIYDVSRFPAPRRPFSRRPRGRGPVFQQI